MDRLPKGITFYLKEYIPIDDLREILLKVARFIQDKGLFEKLYKYEDWWEHDGLHFDNGNIKMGELFKMLESNQALHESMTGEEYVRIGISNEEKRWYLRFYVNWDDDERALEGDFHFSVPREWVDDCKALFKDSKIRILYRDSKKISDSLLP